MEGRARRTETYSDIQRHAETYRDVITICHFSVLKTHTFSELFNVLNVYSKNKFISNR